MIPPYLRDSIRRLRAADRVFDAWITRGKATDSIEMLRRHDHGFHDGRVPEPSPGGFDIGLDSLYHYFGDQM